VTLALNVHAANVIAVHLYKRAGFVDSGEIVRGGRGGPQHLMLRALGVGQWAP
jgi:ribosomal protein S18 acetylase RimI-like enzyme